MYIQTQNTEDNDEGETLEHFYDVVGCIAQGSFGKVYHCTNKTDGSQCAVKVIEKKSVKKGKIDSLRNEARLMQQTSHSHVVKLKSFKQCANHIYLEMELIRHGTIGKLLKNRTLEGKPLTNDEISSIMKGIFSGLSYLHSQNIIHRDLKTCICVQYYSLENILLDDPQDLSKIKIADLGLSIKLDINSSKPNNHCGTLLFMAPEVMRKLPYTKSADVWSAAVIMFMLFNCGEHPYGIRTKMTSEQYLKMTSRPWPKLPDELAQNLIERLSQTDPFNRYSSSEALKHPFLTKNLTDFIPFTYNESFKSFLITHRTSMLIRAGFIISQLFSQKSKIKIDLAYISKVEQQNSLSNRSKTKPDSRYSSAKKITILDQGTSHLNEDNRRSDGVIQEDDKETSSPTGKIFNLISLSFVSQNDDCIKIKDFDEKVQPLSAQTPGDRNKLTKTYKTGSRQSSQNKKINEFLTNSSFSPLKSTKQKKSILNFPKLQEGIRLQPQFVLKKALSIQKQEYVPERNSASPNRRPESSRKYVKASDRSPIKTYKM